MNYENMLKFAVTQLKEEEKKTNEEIIAVVEKTCMAIDIQEDCDR